MKLYRKYEKFPSKKIKQLATIIFVTFSFVFSLLMFFILILICNLFVRLVNDSLVLKKNEFMHSKIGISFILFVFFGCYSICPHQPGESKRMNFSHWCFFRFEMKWNPKGKANEIKKSFLYGSHICFCFSVVIIFRSARCFFFSLSHNS